MGWKGLELLPEDVEAQCCGATTIGDWSKIPATGGAVGAAHAHEGAHFAAHTRRLTFCCRSSCITQGFEATYQCDMAIL